MTGEGTTAQPAFVTSRAWPRPIPREAVEGMRLGLAVVAALYISMRLGLERPEWAAWTVLSVSLATRASSLQKSSWRWLSSLIGGVAAILLMAAFSQHALAFDIALMAWLAAMTFLASIVPGQDSYGFSLMGFTAPLIALPDLVRPALVFQTAVDRCSNLVVGVACAYVASVLVAPGVRTIRATLAQRMRSATKACAIWLEGEGSAPPLEVVLALDQAVRDAFTEQPSLRRVGGGGLQAAPSALLSVVATGLLQRYLPASQAISADALLGWPVAGARWRLRRVEAAARRLEEDRPLGRRRIRAVALPFDRDGRQACNNALRTAIAVGAVEAFWAASGWSHGAGAVIWVSIGALLLANRDNSRRAAFDFLLGAGLADLTGLVLRYTALTSTGAFGSLAAVAFPVGLLAAVGRADKRATTASGFGLVIFTALEPLNPMEYDLAGSLNGLVATLAGLAAAAVAFAALPPPASPSVQRARARRRLERGLRAAARRPALLLPTPQRWCAPMLQRAQRLTPEGLAAVAAAQAQTLAGLVVMALRREDEALGVEAGHIVASSKVRDKATALYELAGRSDVGELTQARLRTLADLLAGNAAG